MDRQHLEEGERKKKRTEEVTRVIALIFVFVCVFYFFVKLLFL